MDTINAAGVLYILSVHSSRRLGDKHICFEAALSLPYISDKIDCNFVVKLAGVAASEDLMIPRSRTGKVLSPFSGT